MTEDAVEKRRRAARETSALGPGTVGYTSSGAAYRGMEVAAGTGAPSPADPGFPVTAVGLHPGAGQGVQGTTAPQADRRSSGAARTSGPDAPEPGGERG
ncbi:MAG: hypothetical protein AB2385_07675 [Symbiobacterium sp.]|uniref:hypothetical protein n=1 Tax=Symbiobacterium sp. TaxID=1971213 RepID=UPI0034642C55